MELFYNKFKYLNNIDEIIKQNKQKWNIDTVLINQIILENIGLKKENIIDSKICSVCNSDIIHSYRVEKEKYKLETAIIGLK
jgi:copper oxidase (laccase) domain-containing protein